MNAMERLLEDDILRIIQADAANNEKYGTLIYEYCEKRIAQIEAKRERAKIQQIEKRAEGDELRAKVLEFLTNIPQTIDQITRCFNDDSITSPMVKYRLSELVKYGMAERETQLRPYIETDEDGNKKERFKRIVVYKRAEGGNE